MAILSNILTIINLAIIIVFTVVIWALYKLIQKAVGLIQGRSIVYKQEPQQEQNNLKKLPVSDFYGNPYYKYF
jgi:hypothetical protein